MEITANGSFVLDGDVQAVVDSLAYAVEFEPDDISLAAEIASERRDRLMYGELSAQSVIYKPIDTVQSLSDILATKRLYASSRAESDEPDWESRSLCVETAPHVFTEGAISATNIAKKICALCPVIDACLEDALDHGITARPGVRGAMSERARQRYVAA